MNKNERMILLSDKGIDTSKYFTVLVPKDVLGEINVPITNQKIKKEICLNGYVKNTKLHRRFIMAQMFRFINYQNPFTQESGFDACLKNCYSYNYTITMMAEEIRVLSILENQDKDCFEERVVFFNRRVIYTVLSQYLTNLIREINHTKIRKCKGIPYKKIGKRNIFIEDIDKKLLNPIRSLMDKIYPAKNYSEINRIMTTFMNKYFIKLDPSTEKSTNWIISYKAEGAFYTLKNMIIYHNCSIPISIYSLAGDWYSEATVSGLKAMERLYEYHKDYENNEHRIMWALLLATIRCNNFNFDQKMREIYK